MDERMHFGVMQILSTDIQQ